MKIIFKILKTGSGGEVYFERLTNQLNKLKGFKSKIEYYDNYLNFFPFLIKIFNKKKEADVIHSNSEYGWVFKEDKIPLIITIHHNVFDESYKKTVSFIQKIFHNLILKPGIKKSLKTADKIIAVSNYTKESILKTFGDHPITVIYNGIDVKKFRPIRIKLKDERFKLLFVGNLIKRKGVDLLPKIMEKLGKNYVLYYTSGLRTNIPENFNLPNMIPMK